MQTFYFLHTKNNLRLKDQELLKSQNLQERKQSHLKRNEILLFERQSFQNNNKNKVRRHLSFTFSVKILDHNSSFRERSTLLT